MRASQYGQTATVQVLIGAGAEVNLRNKVRACAFCIIVFFYRNSCI
jgi:hypothetical protein